MQDEPCDDHEREEGIEREVYHKRWNTGVRRVIVQAARLQGITYEQLATHRCVGSVSGEYRFWLAEDSNTHPKRQNTSGMGKQ